MRFCSIAHAASLPPARVLAHRLAEHHPGARLTVLTLGWERLAPGEEPFDALHPEELGVPGWERLLEDSRWADLTEFFKPHLLSRLMQEGADPAIYLHPSIDLHAPLEPVTRELERCGALFAPRLLGDLPVDGHHPDDDDLRQAGRFGAPLVALGRLTAPGKLLEWWANRLNSSAEFLTPRSPENPYHASRELSRWIDLAPSVFRGVCVLSDPGSAVSYWNLHERRLESEDGELTVDGRPLRFMHFEGFDPSRPFLLSDSSDRVRTSESPVLREICESYASELRDAGWRDHRCRADVGLVLPNGIVFDDRLSHLLAEAAASGQELRDVFTEAGAEAFMRWLEAPAPYGRRHRVNRYLYRLYRERDDLRLTYPDLDGPDGHGFTGWAWAFGLSEMGIPERFLPPRPPGIRLAAPETTSRQPLPRGERPELSVEVAGLLSGTLGLGEAARGYVQGLEAAGIPVSTSTVDVRQFVSLTNRASEGYARVEYADREAPGSAGFNLICINADELPRFAESVGEDFLTERPSIGVWAWETDLVPSRWRGAFDLLDEIWVYSTYVAENLGRAAPIPVQRVPPPVTPPEPDEVRLDLGVPPGFQFLFMFDFFSTIQRKNPVGLIQAFSRAFEPGEGPQLVLKTINGVHRQEALEEVLWAARGRPDVHVIDRSLSAGERDALVAGCDSYVSLHRSEGFGLTLAECMALGKPVIATAFSAPTDFMTEENSYLVPYEMARVGADCEIYPAEGTWADPDVAVAARLMRRVIEQPDEARAKGERARRDIERLYSPRAVGELMGSRLEEISALWSKR